MILRSATPDDVPAITACVNRAYSHYIERIGSPPGPMLDDYAEMVQEHTVFVIEVEAQVAGILVLIQFPDKFLRHFHSAQ